MKVLQGSLWLGLGLLCAIGFGAKLGVFESRPIEAQEPTPTLIPFDPDLSISGITFRWNAPPGVVEFTLSGTAFATVLNRSQPCAPPSAVGQTLVLNERLDGAVTSFTLNLPSLLTGEEWVVDPSPVDLVAFGSGGERLGADRLFVVGEGGLEPGACVTAVPSPLPSQSGGVHLPQTGGGVTRGSGADTTPFMLGALGIACLAASIGWGCRKKRVDS
jgi:hypothetical protein